MAPQSGVLIAATSGDDSRYTSAISPALLSERNCPIGMKIVFVTFAVSLRDRRPPRWYLYDVRLSAKGVAGVGA